ncbi:LysR family transcriptional regulator [Saccharothrix sp. 6-C]|uniref:LysR family transcriptional regulator n=1 Tax=Saccharothrix texasensis TaxID=103734 RepID=A0A3N1HAL8_9PSEU|nr:MULTISPECIES: LysR family transcriptional regulator [Saccharothrix]QQQ76231.1 LysR family transcriptional regulator [Saccharothrix sp. 6-C]ROP39570.1 LysR family transcriptional regulator [Saccharothrix texasensis]
MELRQLEYFVAVAEECHFTRAARRMHVAQSGLSASIRALEVELGAPLFVRSTRQVELTQAGRALLVEARRVLGTIDAARDAVAAVQGLLRGTLAVGSIQCLHAVHLPAVLARFHELHPGVELRLRQAGSGELVDLVRAGRLDLAFVTSGRAADDLAVSTLSSEPLVLACAPELPFAERESVRLAELSGQAFVDFNPDWGTRDDVDRALATAGVDRRVAVEVNDVHSLLDFVGFGLGVALVPASFAAKQTRARFVELLDAPTAETLVVTTPTVSAAASVLLDMVLEAGRGLPVAG